MKECIINYYYYSKKDDFNILSDDDSVPELPHLRQNGHNTGPKGVLADYKEAKENQKKMV